MLLTGMLSVIAPGSIMQLLLAVALCVVFLTASAWCKPYADDRVNGVKRNSVCTVVYQLQ